MGTIWVPESIYNKLPSFYVGLGLVAGFFLGKIGLVIGLGLIGYGLFRKCQRI